MAKTIPPGELRRRLRGETPPLLLDVRRASDRVNGPPGIPGADWRDPARLEHWVESVPEGREVALYCARGGSVSQGVQAALAARGISACCVEGGLEAWLADEALWSHPDVGLLRGQGMEEGAVAHAVRVASTGLWLAGRLDPAKAGPLDMELVRRGGLLHDLGKVRDVTNLHGVAGAVLGRSLGVPEPVLGCIEKHVRHGPSALEARGYGLPGRDFCFTRVEERIVSYADKLSDVLAAGLAGSAGEAHERLPEILRERPGLAKDEATEARYLASRELFAGWMRPPDQAQPLDKAGGE